MKTTKLLAAMLLALGLASTLQVGAQGNEDEASTGMMMQHGEGMPMSPEKMQEMMSSGQLPMMNFQAMHQMMHQMHGKGMPMMGGGMPMMGGGMPMMMPQTMSPMHGQGMNMMGGGMPAMMPQMMQMRMAHMQRMEQHLQKIESLLAQILEQQQKQ